MVDGWPAWPLRRRSPGAARRMKPSSGGTTSSAWIQTDLAGADLDGDGRTDIVTIATLQQSFGVSDGTLKIYRQTTPGSFVASTIQVGSYPWRLKISDVNGDGAPDLLVLDVIGGSGANDDVLYLLLQDVEQPRPLPRAARRRERAVGQRLRRHRRQPRRRAGHRDRGRAGRRRRRRAVPAGAALARGTFEAPSVLNLAGRVAARRGRRRRRFRARWTWSPIRSWTRARTRTRRGSWSSRTRPCSTPPARRRSS